MKENYVKKHTMHTSSFRKLSGQTGNACLIGTRFTKSLAKYQLVTNLRRSFSSAEHLPIGIAATRTEIPARAEALPATAGNVLVKFAARRWLPRPQLVVDFR